MQWYYSLNGRQQGPVSEAEFAALVSQGTIKAETLVWREGMAGWQAYVQVAPSAGGGTEPPAGEDTAVCAVSGRRYLKREMIQYEGQWISAEHRDAYFQRLREGVLQPGGHGAYAGFWIRFVAKIIDIVALVAISMVYSMIFGGLIAATVRTTSAGGPPQIGRLLGLEALMFALNIGTAILYTWFFVSRYNATPGKLALGLRLLRADGSPLSTGRIVGRYFAEMVSAVILYIGFIMAGFDDEKRALHDRICDTRVFKAK